MSLRVYFSSLFSVCQYITSITVSIFVCVFSKKMSFSQYTVTISEMITKMESVCIVGDRTWELPIDNITCRETVILHLLLLFFCLRSTCWVIDHWKINASIIEYFHQYHLILYYTYIYIYLEESKQKKT